MREGTQFLVLEFPGDGLTMADWARDNPGATIDMISEPVRTKEKDPVHPTLFLVKGAPRAALVQLMDRMDRLYGPLETLRMDPTRGQWLARMQVRESAMHSSSAAAVLQFQHRFGAPWTHIDDGIVYMRARLPPGDDGERLAEQVRGYLAEKKVDAQVMVQDFSSHDYGVWDDLVQASIGLAP